jgi:hypothetical protein
MIENKWHIIGVGGYARAGKDLFVKIASKILSDNGYTPRRIAFADALKMDIDDWLISRYGISAWTDKDSEKNLIRPLLVAHGCQKRFQTQGKYWVDKAEGQLRLLAKNLVFEETDKKKELVFLVSDVRFPNEGEWIHGFDGWVVHLRKYRNKKYPFPLSFLPTKKEFDKAPNAEEAQNDPLLAKISDYHLDLEQVLDNKNSQQSLLGNSYLNREIKLCLTQCPFLTIQTP